ncbi:MAG: NfeD family protein [Thermodesulfobacteriota bacterium]|nr:NfeD family protein [Thermodesulfobacteriota bacterium]
MSKKGRDPGTIKRYVWIQSLETLVFILALAVLARWIDISAWVFLLIVLAWILKDILLFPLVSKAYEPEGRDPLIGKTAIIEEVMDPSGYVRVGAERWHCKPSGDDQEINDQEINDQEIKEGEEVRIKDRQGLILIVEKKRQ